MWLAVLNENGELAGSISQAPDMASLSELFDAAGDEIVKNADSVVPVSYTHLDVYKRQK